MSRAPATPEYLRPREIADRLACRVEMILDAIAKGSLPAVNISRGANRPTWRIHRDDFAGWARARMNTPPAAPTPRPAPKTKKKKTTDLIEFY